MSISKHFIKFAILIIILFTPVYLSALNLNQVIVLKKNGSGTLTILYTAKESEVKAKNFQIGNFPFSKDKFNEYFSSATNKIFTSKVETHPEDNTLTRVTISLSVGNFVRLNEMKAFQGVNISFADSDTGKVFKQVYNENFIKTNSLENTYIKFKSDEDFKSTNGEVNNNEITFFRDKKFVTGKNDVTFAVTFKSQPKTSETGEKENSCGLFGLELPILLSVGLAFSRYKMNRISQTK